MYILNRSGPVISSGIDFRRFLRIDENEATLARRGFVPVSTEAQLRLDTVGRTFLAGYDNMISSVHLASFSQDVAVQSQDLQGFFAEGAAMGAALQDALSLRPWRLQRLREIAGSRFDYLLHVGAGWAIARLPLLRRRVWARLDPLLLPLSVDGWGFHDTYFLAKTVIAGRRRRLPHGLGAAYDQGVGRGLWFASGAAIDIASDTIHNFDAERHADLVAGLALAMAYCGPASAADWQRFLKRFPNLIDHATQGVAFAAAARAEDGSVDAENLAVATKAAAGAAPRALAEIVRTTRPDHDPDRTPKSGWTEYQAWRAVLRTRLTSQPAPLETPGC